jgi:hypothetical protein
MMELPTGGLVYEPNGGSLMPVLIKDVSKVLSKLPVQTHASSPQPTSEIS